MPKHSKLERNIRIDNVLKTLHCTKILKDNNNNNNNCPIADRHLINQLEIKKAMPQ
ncbi:MAG TPA: hypothetical protein VFZ67_07075 [Nitrososphaera sp.]